jgi:hypothetical protein
MMSMSDATKRYENAVALREQGLTYREIAQRLGVGQSRAHQLVMLHNVLRRDGLSTRARNIIANMPGSNYGGADWSPDPEWLSTRLDELLKAPGCASKTLGGDPRLDAEEEELATMENVGGVLALLVVLSLYFLPAIAAHKRRHRNAEAITVLNVLLGWTFLGWIIALVWAHTDNRKPEFKLDRRQFMRDIHRPQKG